MKTNTANDSSTRFSHQFVSFFYWCTVCWFLSSSFLAYNSNNLNFILHTTCLSATSAVFTGSVLLSEAFVPFTSFISVLMHAIFNFYVEVHPYLSVFCNPGKRFCTSKSQFWRHIWVSVIHLQSSQCYKWSGSTLTDLFYYIFVLKCLFFLWECFFYKL